MMLVLAIVLIGTVAPDWSGKTPDGRATRLSELTRDRPAVVLTAPDPKWKPPEGVAVLIAPEAARLLEEMKAALIDTGPCHTAGRREWRRGKHECTRHLALLRTHLASQHIDYRTAIVTGGLIRPAAVTVTPTSSPGDIPSGTTA